MSLIFKYNKDTYHPDNRLAMYDLLYRLTDAEERIQQLEAHRDILQREIARLDVLIPSSDSQHSFLSNDK